MTAPIVGTRLVYHISGYDFTMTVEAVQRRFLRELRRFQTTWSVRSTATAPVVGADETALDVDTDGPNWHVHTSYRFFRWDDVIAADGRKPFWRRVVAGLLALLIAARTTRPRRIFTRPFPTIITKTRVKSGPLTIGA